MRVIVNTQLKRNYSLRVLEMFYLAIFSRNAPRFLFNIQPCDLTVQNQHANMHIKWIL